jgi:hypothetical protein
MPKNERPAPDVAPACYVVACDAVGFALRGETLEPWAGVDIDRLVALGAVRQVEEKE